MEDLPIESLANLTGKSKDNLYFYKTKYKFQNKTHAAIDKMRKIYLKLYPDPLKQEKPEKVTTSIKWLKQEINPCLQKVYNGPSIRLLHSIISSDPVTHNSQYWSKRLRLPETTISQWISAAQNLSNLPTIQNAPRYKRPKNWQNKHFRNPSIKNSNNEISFEVMKWPEQQQDIRDMQHTFKNMQLLRCNNPQLADWGIDFYIDNVIASHTDIYIKEESNLIKFVEFIKALKFTEEQIQIRLRPNGKPLSLSTVEQIQYWRQLLSLNRSHFIIEPKPLTRVNKKYGSIRVTVINRTIDDENYIASYGFNFALYMISVLTDCIIISK